MATKRRSDIPQRVEAEPNVPSREEAFPAVQEDEPAKMPEGYTGGDPLEWEPEKDRKLTSKELSSAERRYLQEYPPSGMMEDQALSNPSLYQDANPEVWRAYQDAWDEYDEEKKTEARRQANKHFYGVDDPDYEPDWVEWLRKRGYSNVGKVLEEGANTIGNMLIDADNSIGNLVSMGVEELAKGIDFYTPLDAPDWMVQFGKKRRSREEQDSVAALYAFGNLMAKGAVNLDGKIFTADQFYREFEEAQQRKNIDDAIREESDGVVMDSARGVSHALAHLVGFVKLGPLRVAQGMGKAFSWAGLNTVARSAEKMARATKGITGAQVDKAIAEGKLIELLAEKTYGASRVKALFLKGAREKLEGNVLPAMAGFGGEAFVRQDGEFDERAGLAAYTALMTPGFIFAARLGDGLAKQLATQKSWNPSLAAAAGGAIEGTGFTLFDLHLYKDVASAIASGDGEALVQAMGGVAKQALAFGIFKGASPHATDALKSMQAQSIPQSIARKAGIPAYGPTFDTINRLHDLRWEARDQRKSRGNGIEMVLPGRGSFKVGSEDGTISVEPGQLLAKAIGVPKKRYTGQMAEETLSKIETATAIDALQRSMLDINPEWQQINAGGEYWHPTHGYWAFRFGKSYRSEDGKSWRVSEQRPMQKPEFETGEQMGGGGAATAVLPPAVAGISKWTLERQLENPKDIDTHLTRTLIDYLKRVDPSRDPNGRAILEKLNDPEIQKAMESEVEGIEVAVAKELAAAASGAKTVDRAFLSISDHIKGAQIEASEMAEMEKLVRELTERGVETSLAKEYSEAARNQGGGKDAEPPKTKGGGGEGERKYPGDALKAFEEGIRETSQTGAMGAKLIDKAIGAMERFWTGDTTSPILAAGRDMLAKWSGERAVAEDRATLMEREIRKNFPDPLAREDLNFLLHGVGNPRYDAPEFQANYAKAYVDRLKGTEDLRHEGRKDTVDDVIDRLKKGTALLSDSNNMKPGILSMMLERVANPKGESRVDPTVYAEKVLRPMFDKFFTELVDRGWIDAEYYRENYSPQFWEDAAIAPEKGRAPDREGLNRDLRSTKQRVYENLREGIEGGKVPKFDPDTGVDTMDIATAFKIHAKMQGEVSATKALFEGLANMEIPSIQRGLEMIWGRGVTKELFDKRPRETWEKKGKRKKKGLEPEWQDQEFLEERVKSLEKDLKSAVGEKNKSLAAKAFKEARQDLEKLVGTTRALMLADAPSHYKEVNHPLFFNKEAGMFWKVHPELHDPIHRLLSKPNPSRVVDFFRAANGLAKSLELSMSGFHAWTLGFESAFMTGSGFTPKDIFRDINLVSRAKAGSRILDERKDFWLRNNLELGRTIDPEYDRPIQVLRALQRGVSKIAPGSVENPADIAIRKAVDMVEFGKNMQDRFLWDLMHRNYKLEAAERLYGEAMKRRNDEWDRRYQEEQKFAAEAGREPKDVPPPRTDRQVARATAQFVNTAFGGRSWETHWRLSKENLKRLQDTFLAIDWTTSNFDVGMRGLLSFGDFVAEKGLRTLGNEKIEAALNPFKRMMQGQLASEGGPQTRTFASKEMALNYFHRSMWLKTLFPIVAQAGILSALSDEETRRKWLEGDGEGGFMPPHLSSGRSNPMNPWGIPRGTFAPWGNSVLGDWTPWSGTGRVAVGFDESGRRERYIKVNKQINEFFEWFTDPLGVTMKKTGPVPKILLGMFTERQGDYPLDFHDMKFPTFWEDLWGRAAFTGEFYMPLTLRSILSKGDAKTWGFTFPASMGLTDRQAIDMAADLIGKSADGIDSHLLHPDFERLFHSSRQNAIQFDRVFRTARTKLRQKYYSEAFALLRDLSEHPDKKPRAQLLEQTKKKLVRLGVTKQDMLNSLRLSEGGEILPGGKIEKDINKFQRDWVQGRVDELMILDWVEKNFQGQPSFTDDDPDVASGARLNLMLEELVEFHDRFRVQSGGELRQWMDFEKSKQKK